jgi:hypothetical protein
MKKLKNVLGAVQLRFLIGITAIIISLTLMISVADYPKWWVDRGVVNSNVASTNDYAAANQGQLKHIATEAYGEFANVLSGLDLAAISNVVSDFSSSNNFSAVNLGQLKYVAQPFYDVLGSSYSNAWPVGMTVGPYPWNAFSANVNDNALANIGQLKYLFSFDLNNISIDPFNIDSDSDGMPDDYEVLVGLNPADSSDATPAVLAAYAAAAAVDPDGDGFPDWRETWLATNPYDSFDFD